MGRPDFPPPARLGGELSAQEARAALAAAQGAMGRSGRVAREGATRAPLAIWGVAWLLGYCGLQFLPFGLAWGLWVPLGGLAYAGSRWRGERAVRSGWEARFLRAWWVTVVATAALVTIVAPAPLVVVALLPGAIWALAFILYAVVVEDRPLGLLGGGMLLLAVALRLALPDLAPLLFGLGGGGGMVALGLARARGRWR